MAQPKWLIQLLRTFSVWQLVALVATTVYSLISLLYGGRAQFPTGFETLALSEVAAVSALSGGFATVTAITHDIQRSAQIMLLAIIVNLFAFGSLSLSWVIIGPVPYFLLAITVSLIAYSWYFLVLVAQIVTKRATSKSAIEVNHSAVSLIHFWFRFAF